MLGLWVIKLIVRAYEEERWLDLIGISLAAWALIGLLVWLVMA